MPTDKNRDNDKFDGTEGEREPGVDVAKPLGEDVPENRSDDRSMSKKITKELPRHEGALENVGLDPAEQRDVFEYQVVVLPVGEGQESDPGPDNAAVTAAINAGYRTTGEAELSGPEDHPDGVSKVWTWKVPVIKVKGPVRPAGLDNARVEDRHDDGAKTPAENRDEAAADVRAQDIDPAKLARGEYDDDKSDEDKASDKPVAKRSVVRKATGSQKSGGN